MSIFDNKTNKNSRYRIEESGSQFVTASVDDNFYVSKPIPASDFGYAWVTASALESSKVFLKNGYSVGEEDITNIDRSFFGTGDPFDRGYTTNWQTNLASYTDDEIFAIGGASGSIKVYDIDPYNSVQVSPTTYILNSSSLLWEYSASLGYGFSSLAIDQFGNVYGGASGSGADLYKISSRGTLEWQFTNFTDTITGIAVDATGSVYASSVDNTVKKIDSSGTEVWSVTPAATEINGIDIDQYGYIYIAREDNTLQSLENVDGSDRWNTASFSDVVNDVAADTVGYVYGVSDDNTLQKFAQSDGTQQWSETSLGSVDLNHVAVTRGGEYIFVGNESAASSFGYDNEGNRGWGSVNSGADLHGIATIFVPKVDHRHVLVRAYEDTSFGNIFQIDSQATDTVLNAGRAAFSSQDISEQARCVAVRRFHQPNPLDKDITKFTFSVDLENYSSDLNSNFTVTDNMNRAYLARVATPYGYPSWVQVRPNSHAVYNSLKKTSQLIVLDPPPVSYNGYKQIKARWGITQTKYEIPSLTSRYKPMTHNFEELERYQDRDISIPVNLVYDYSSMINYFPIEEIDKKLSVPRKGVITYHALHDKYVKNTDSNMGDFRVIKYSEVIWPQERNTYLDKARSRPQFFFNWKDKREERTVYDQVNSQGETIPTSSLWPLDARENYRTETLYTTASTDHQGDQGELLNVYSVFHNGDATRLKAGALFSYPFPDSSSAGVFFTNSTQFEVCEEDYDPNVYFMMHFSFIGSRVSGTRV